MTPPRAPVLVIGLGSMGGGAAASLLRAGFEVRGLDPSVEASARFAALGGRPVATAAEGAAGAGAVLTLVVNAEQTEAALFGEGGAAAALAPGAVVVACATVPPAYAEELAPRLAAREVHLLDAPVSGGAAKAAAGAMSVMASGSEAAFAAAAPVLAAVAAKVHRLGPAPGLGSRVKMINQLLAGVHIAAACEAVALGLKAGADAAQLYEVISGAAGASWMFNDRVPHILEADYAPRSAVDIFVKDLGIVREAGEALGLALPMAEAAHALFRAASAAGLGREDDSAVVKVYAARGGVALPGGAAPADLSPDLPAGG